MIPALLFGVYRLITVVAVRGGLFTVDAADCVSVATIDFHMRPCRRRELDMTRKYSIPAAVLLGFALSQGAMAQAYPPVNPIIKPNVLPKPVANRLIKRPTISQQKDAEQADK